MEDRTIEINRVSTVEVGDKILWAAIWRLITDKTIKKIYFEDLKKPGSNKDFISSNSNQFVQIERKK